MQDYRIDCKVQLSGKHNNFAKTQFRIVRDGVRPESGRRSGVEKLSGREFTEEFVFRGFYALICGLFVVREKK